MPTTFKHLSPFAPLRLLIGMGWRGYKLYGDLRTVLPKKALVHIEGLGERVRGRLEEIGLNATTHTRHAEAVVDIMYQELQRFEHMIDTQSPTEKIYAQIVRNTVVDWELILLPERNEIFELFGVERHAPFSTIKFRYRQLARMLHPDKPYGNVDRMSEVNNAYSILCRMRGTN